MEPPSKRRRGDHYQVHQISHPHFRAFHSTPNDEDRSKSRRFEKELSRDHLNPREFLDNAPEHPGRVTLAANSVANDGASNDGQETDPIDSPSPYLSHVLSPRSPEDTRNDATLSTTISANGRTTIDQRSPDEGVAAIVSILNTFTEIPAGVSAAVAAVTSPPSSNSQPLSSVESSLSTPGSATMSSLPSSTHPTMHNNSSSTLMLNSTRTAFNSTKTSQNLTTMMNGIQSTSEIIFTWTSDDFVETATSTPHSSLRGGAPSSSAPSATSTPQSSPASNDPPPAGVIAGGIVGGAAGLAVILLLAMLFLRWNRRRSTFVHRTISSPLGFVADSDRPPDEIGEEKGRVALLGSALPALFRPQRTRNNSEAPYSLQSDTGREFVRLSGRKLPSQFSGGIDGAGLVSCGNVPASHRTFSTNPSYSSLGADQAHRLSSRVSYPESMHDPFNDTAEQKSLSTGPQRRVTLHRGGSYASPSVVDSRDSFASWNLPSASATHLMPESSGLAVGDRSYTALSHSSSGLDGSSTRGSKFTEQV